jgi:hypothetical protein
MHGDKQAVGVLFLVCYLGLDGFFYPPILVLGD